MSFFSAVESDHADVRDAQGWGQLEPDFDGYADLRAMMPNYGPASLAWEQGQNAGVSEAGSGLASTVNCEPEVEAAQVHTQRPQPQDRAKQKNRAAQKKFRDRQKVRPNCSSLVATLLSETGPQHLPMSTCLHTFADQVTGA